MAAADQPIVQKITLDVAEAKQTLAELRAEWNAMKAEMGSGIRVGSGAGGNGSAPAYAPSVNAGGLNGSSYTPPSVNGSGGGTANAGGLSAGVNVGDHSDNGPAGQRRRAAASSSWQNPDTGAWVSGPETVVNRARSAYWRQQEREANAFNRDAVRSVRRSNQEDWARSGSVNNALHEVYSSLDWMRGEVSDLQARPDILERERPMRAVGTYLIAEHAINAVSQTANIALSNSRTGRATTLTDLAPAGFSLLAGGTALALAPENPVMAAMAASGGQAAGNAVQQLAMQAEERRMSAAQMAYGNPSSGGYGSILDALRGLSPAASGTASTLAGSLAPGLGSGASNAAVANLQTLKGAMPDAPNGPLKWLMDKMGIPDAAQSTAAEALRSSLRDIPGIGAVSNVLFGQGQQIATQAGNALSTIADPELQRYLAPNAPYSHQGALQIAGRYGVDAATAYIKSKGGTDDASALANTMANISISTARAGLETSRVGEFASNVTRVTASGGTAGQIGAAMGGELDQLEGARAGLRRLVDELKGVQDGSTKAAQDLQNARNALAETSAQIAQVSNQRATVASGERMDIAGTATARATAGLQMALGSARSGDAGIFASSIAGIGGELEAARTGLADPWLTPTQKRELDRTISADSVSLWNLRKRAADFGPAFSEARAATGAAYTGLSGSAAMMGTGSAGSVSNILQGEATAQQGAANASWRHLAAMEASPFFSADELDAVRLRAAGASLNASQLRVQSAGPGLSPGEQATMAGLDAATGWAMRNGGSAAAAPLIGQGLATLGAHAASLPAALSRALATARTPEEANAMRYGNQTAVASDWSQILALQEARGSYQPSASLGMEADAARFAVQKAELGPFFSTNPVGAYRSLMSVNSRMLGQMRDELNAGGLDQAAVRTRTQQIQALELDQARLTQQLNYGWEGRLMQMSSNMPSFSAQYAGTFRDALLGGAENRVYGSLGAAGAARNREGQPMGGSDATWRPGDAFAQGIQMARMPTVPIEVTVKVVGEDGSYQGSSRQTATIRGAAGSDPMKILVEARR